MTSLSFPDINVWLALATNEHVHSQIARHWWKKAKEQICFCRLTQLGLLRLLTTAAAMGGKPLTLDEAWQVYDGFFGDARVAFMPESAQTEAHFRLLAQGDTPAPKVWGDTWLLAVAEAADGTLVTFDRALAPRGAHCLLGARK